MLGNSKELYYDKIMYEVDAMDTWALRLEQAYELGDRGRLKNVISCAKRILNNHIKELRDLLNVYKTL